MENKLQHVAIIMDGNGRYAKKHKMPITWGHSKGMEQIEQCIKTCINNDIKYLSLYAFSTENWKRSDKEIKHLLSLVKKFYKLKKDVFIKEQIRFNLIGSRNNIPPETLAIFDEFMEITKDNKRLTLNVCFNYGSQLEIVEAVNQIIKDQLPSVDINTFNNYLYTKKQPPVDLLIRTSGEYRLSNFLLWQSSYAELVFCDCLWPEFDKEALQAAISEYYKRKRRFGGR